MADKVSADTWRKVERGDTRHLLVEFRDTAIEIEARDALALRPAHLQARAAIDRKSQRYRLLKARSLAALTTQGVGVTRDYSHLPLAFVHVRDANALRRLLERPEVVAAYENRRLRPLSAELDLIGQPQAKQLLGRSGAGKTVVVLDTGVDFAGAAFGACVAPGTPADGCKVVAALDITLAYGASPYPPALPAPPYYPSYDDGARDNSGHGTAVAARVLGVAADARIAALDVMNEPPWTDFTGATADTIIAGINWAKANQATYDIVAINISLGGGDGHPDPCATDNPLATPVQEARQSGILTVVASGNNGYADGLNWPACTPGVISVGAVWSADTSSTCQPGLKDTVACFSNHADYLTLLAPAAATSLAAPLASGAAAVLAEAYPAEQPDAWSERMTASGKPVADHRSGGVTGLGHVAPRLDLPAALLYPDTGAPANDDFANATPLAGDSGASLGWNRFATRETGEPAHATMAGDASVWWLWTATTSGTVALDTHGSSFDTLLAVYTGAAVDALAPVAANDDDGYAGGGGVSGLSFHAEAGSTYHLVVEGKAGASGNLYLTRAFSADPAGSVNLSLSLTDSPDPVAVGATLAYALTVRNSGPATATGVTASLTLPAATSFQSADAGCAHAAGVLTCVLGSLAAGAQATASVRVTAQASGSLVATASVTSAASDGDPANNSAMAGSTVTPDSGDPGGGDGDVPLPAWSLLLLGGALAASLRPRLARRSTAGARA